MKTTVYQRIFAAFLFAACLAQSLSAAEYYVKADGNDSRDGKSLENAFKTWTKVLNTASEGDMIYLSGTVTGGVAFTSKTLTIKGINDATIDVNFASRCMEINGGNICVENITLTQGYRAAGGNGGIKIGYGVIINRKKHTYAKNNFL
jgi:hypothetical protein